LYASSDESPEESINESLDESSEENSDENSDIYLNENSEESSDDSYENNIYTAFNVNGKSYLCYLVCGRDGDKITLYTDDDDRYLYINIEKIIIVYEDEHRLFQTLSLSEIPQREYTLQFDKNDDGSINFRFWHFCGSQIWSYIYKWNNVTNQFNNVPEFETYDVQ
jgi:hypothetical protein